jgi:hypothetical protein
MMGALAAGGGEAFAAAGGCRGLEFGAGVLEVVGVEHWGDQGVVVDCLDVFMETAVVFDGLLFLFFVFLFFLLVAMMGMYMVLAIVTCTMLFRLPFLFSVGGMSTEVAGTSILVLFFFFLFLGGLAWRVGRTIDEVKIRCSHVICMCMLYDMVWLKALNARTVGKETLCLQTKGNEDHGEA